MTETPRRGPVQAPVQPVDEDGVVAAATGTAAFAVAAVVLAIYRDQLAASGRSWWFMVAVAGVLIGLGATLYTTWRARARKQPAVELSEQTAAAEAVEAVEAVRPVGAAESNTTIEPGRPVGAARTVEHPTPVEPARTVQPVTTGEAVETTS